MKLKEHIFLIGFMGCGKSTNAGILAKLTGAEQIDMDQEIIREQGMEIKEIFEKYGESYFRDLETELLKKLKTKEPMIVSCGGGAALRKENADLMKESGKIVLLTARPETIYERVKERKNRPLLSGNMNVEYITELMEKRRPKYEAAADFAVPTDGRAGAEICKEILENIKKAAE